MKRENTSKNWKDTDDSSIVQNKDFRNSIEGYEDVLAYVTNLISVREETNILNLNIGTGQLAKEFYDKGAKICGVDYSENRLQHAKSNMPDAELACHDFSLDLPNEFKTRKFHYMVSLFALHHLEDEDKVSLILNLVSSLKKGGTIILADLGLESEQQRKQCEQKGDSMLDETKNYMLGPKIATYLNLNGLKASYTQISSCTGVLTVKKR